MAQENVEIVRRAMDAYNLGDKDGWAKFMDPELETFPVPEFPEPGPLIGRTRLGISTSSSGKRWRRASCSRPLSSRPLS
jgi:ketosteroid isomerase-like protein